MTIEFAPLQEAAINRFGSMQALADKLPKVRTVDELELISDDRYLSAMCLRVFRAGMSHDMVDAKWPAFEETFDHFNIQTLKALSDDELESRMNQDGLIKNWDKIKAIRTNAQLLAERAAQHGSVGHWIATWPEEDIIGLWADIADNGAFMGGKSAAAFLRYIGKDTFLLTDDVVAVLTNHGVISGNPTTKANLAAIQAQFNFWQHSSHLPFSHISQIIAFSLAD